MYLPVSTVISLYLQVSPCIWWALSLARLSTRARGSLVRARAKSRARTKTTRARTKRARARTRVSRARVAVARATARDPSRDRTTPLARALEDTSRAWPLGLTWPLGRSDLPMLVHAVCSETRTSRHVRLGYKYCCNESPTDRVCPVVGLCALKVERRRARGELGAKARSRRGTNTRTMAEIVPKTIV